MSNIDKEYENEPFWIENRIEMSVAAILIVASIILIVFNKIQPETGVIIGITAALFTCFNALLKQHASNGTRQILNTIPILRKEIFQTHYDLRKEIFQTHYDVKTAISKSSQIGLALERMNDENIKRGHKIIDETISELEKMNKGIDTLNTTEYFHFLIREMEESGKGTKIIAVNSININRWKVDPKQENYRNENFLAIKRGATISRIFILKEKEISPDASAKVRETINEQISNHLDVSIVEFDQLHRDKSLKQDFVLFDHGGNKRACAFKDTEDPEDDTRVLEGERIRDAGQLDDLKENFAKLLKYKMTSAALSKFLNTSKP